MRLDVYVHFDPLPADDRLDEVLTILKRLGTEIGAVMAVDLAPLTAQVAANTTVIGSALALINGFAAQLEAAGTDPAKLADLQSQLKTQDDALAAAVLQNTPQAPAAPAPTG